MSLIRIDGLVTRYKILGRGKPVVFLHGWGGSSQSFYHLQKILSRNYKTIALDLPGFGETDFPPKAWRLEDYKNFVLAFTQKLELENFYLVGHSFGGRIAILLAALHPEEMRGLVLIASAGIKHEKSPEERAVSFVAKLGKRIISLPLINRLEEPTRYLFYRLIRRQDYYLARGVMKETIMHVIQEDLNPYLSQISLPTLIIWGDKDEITPIQDAYTMKQEIRRAELEIIKGGSHYLPKRYGKELASLIKQFIA
ncbi:MAG: alpha/beta hydrolase [Candidatus Portnoybacteria bacterium]|nr:alpha/beta hydrolase [Candidatus Portnoybacteria bacterium]